MIGIVDVGGGLRGIFGAGVLDYCMEEGIRFDYCIGVSAGSANVTSYAAHQPGRNYHYYIEYSFRKAYMSFENFVKKGSYLDLDYIYSTLYNADGENPLDYPALKASGLPIRIVATSAIKGEAVYFTQDMLKQDSYHVIKASCSLPIVNRPYVIDGVPYYDGGLSDPIPFQKAFQDGCDRVIVILTKPIDFYRDDRLERFLSRFIQKRYPGAAALLSRRNALYREELKQLQQFVQLSKAMIVAPKSIYEMGTLTKDKKILHQLYEDAREAAKAIPAFVDRIAVSKE